MPEEIVKRWFMVRGFGFIGCDRYEEEVFVRHPDIRDRSTLRKGPLARFDVEDTDRGSKVVNAKVIPE
ncbi:MAG: cold-shock protein [Candidatus Bathyarchaeia archaeon]